MIEKYGSVRLDILDYISNRCELGIGVNIIAKEVYNKFPVFVAFYKSSTDMVLESIELLVWSCYVYKFKNFEPKLGLFNDEKESGGQLPSV
jgi:hypothetical protein